MDNAIFVLLFVFVLAIFVVMATRIKSLQGAVAVNQAAVIQVTTILEETQDILSRMQKSELKNLEIQEKMIEHIEKSRINYSIDEIEVLKVEE